MGKRKEIARYAKSRGEMQYIFKTWSFVLRKNILQQLDKSHPRFFY